MEGLPVSKDRERSEREKLRNMIFREKLSYIWEYYKYYIVGGIIGITLTISLYQTCALTSNTGFVVAWSAGPIDNEHIVALTDFLDTNIIGADSNETSEVAVFFTVNDDPAFMTNYFQRLVAMLSANSIDIILLDMNALISYSVSEFVSPLDFALGEIKRLDPALYDIIMEEAVYTMYGQAHDENLLELTAIRVTDSPLMKRLGFDPAFETYLGIAISTNQLDRVIKTLMLFFE